MTPPTDLELSATSLCGAQSIFQGMADDLVLRIRSAIGVPQRAEDDVEQEFAALRATFDEFFPEFAKIFGGTLDAFLGGALPLIVPALEDESVQAYIRVANAIDAETVTMLQAMSKPLKAALGSPLETARPVENVSPPR